MARLIWICKLVFALSSLISCKGSQIDFHASPAVVKEGLTSNITIHCALMETSGSSTIIGKRDVTKTTSSVAVVISVMVTKDNKDVAFVSQTESARVMDSANNILVKGSTTNTSEGRAFLQLTIEDPIDSQSGEYACAVHALDHLGHVVTFSANLDIESSAPTSADIIAYLREVNRDKENMKKHIGTLEKKVESLEKKTDNVVVFGAGLTVNTNLNSGGQSLIFDKIYVNIGDSYNSSSGVFTCKVPGYYQFTGSSMSCNNQQVGLGIFVNGVSQANYFTSSGYGQQHQTNTMSVKLDQGDKVQIKSYYSTCVYGSATNMHATFNGFLIATI